MLLQEPWCLTPAQIADLTPWQVEHCYLRPAVERAERMEAGGSGRPVGQGNGHDWSDLPDRAEFVGGMVANCGNTPEHWGRVWDRMAAERGDA